MIFRQAPLACHAMLEPWLDAFTASLAVLIQHVTVNGRASVTKRTVLV